MTLDIATLDRTLDLVRGKLGNLIGEAPAQYAAAAGQALTPDQVAQLPAAALGAYCDHTLLKPESTWQQVEVICREALSHRFAAICINPVFVARCRPLLEGSGVGLATVVGFPLGANTPAIKARETAEAIKDGATEIDMVINLGCLRAGEYVATRDDIRAVVDAAAGVPVKVILETGGLSVEDKIIACLLSQAAGATFVKTSTGFLFGGATVEDVALMRHVIGPKMGVKASGGIRDEAGARAMLAAGATRLGTSAAMAIVGAQNQPAGGGY